MSKTTKALFLAAVGGLVRGTAEELAADLLRARHVWGRWWWMEGERGEEGNVSVCLKRGVWRGLCPCGVGLARREAGEGQRKPAKAHW